MYEVTTPRQGTTLQAELRDAQGGPAIGWLLTISSLGAGGVGSSATGINITALTMGGSFPVSLLVRAPDSVVAAQTMTIHVWSTSLLDDGSEEAGIVENGALVSVASVPPPPTPTAEPTATSTDAPTEKPARTPEATQRIGTPVVGSDDTASPVAPSPGTSESEFSAASIVNGGEITCTNPGVDELAPGGTVTFTCSAPLAFGANATYLASIATSGWTVKVNGGAAGTSQSVTLTGVWEEPCRLA